MGGGEREGTSEGSRIIRPELEVEVHEWHNCIQNSSNTIRHIVYHWQRRLRYLSLSILFAPELFRVSPRTHSASSLTSIYRYGHCT